MKILLLLNQSYPNGYALPKRFHLYAKGFIRNGNIAKIIIPIPTDKFGSLSDNPICGIYEDVPFEYSANRNIRSNHFFQRRYFDMYGLIRTTITIYKEKPDIIITSNFSLFFIILIKLISIIVPFKLIKEKCEIDYLNNEVINKYQHVLIKLINNLYNGFIFITKYIEEFHIQEIKSKKPFINVPILIEDSKFIDINSNSIKYILYTGTFLERKDGIITILKAFSIFIKKHPDYILILTGSPEISPSYQQIINIIDKENIKSNIKFTGYLHDDELRNVAMNAELHMLTKPFNRQNHYNFSTRIGECLVTGIPILATKVGIISEFLTDNTNVFFTDFSPESIAERMVYIIEHKELAHKIGYNGRIYAINNFDFEFHTHRMIQFFGMLNKKNIIENSICIN